MHEHDILLQMIERWVSNKLMDVVVARSYFDKIVLRDFDFLGHRALDETVKNENRLSNFDKSLCVRVCTEVKIQFGRKSTRKKQFKIEIFRQIK